MFWQSAVTAALLASGAQASLASLIAEGMSRDSPAYHRRMEEAAERTVMLRNLIEQRQTMSAGSNVLLNADGSINMPAWDAQATEACNEALNHLPEASNPSGTCICYNLPALNNQTGTFEADLRLFQLSTPNGQFAGIPPEKIQVGLSYKGASVSPVSAQTASKKVLGAAAAVIPRQTFNANNNVTQLKLLQTYLFVGQIDQSQMNPKMTMAQLEALVMPVVTLSAVNAAGQTISTNVSSNEAAFVAGVFSQEVVMSVTAMAQAAVDDEVAGLKNGTVAFVLPGVDILIFPVGLVITGTWMVLGLAVYGAGTVARIGFADSYRRRAQVSKKSSAARI